eukprot:TRINITY_DN11684_c0_g3_i1.p2 TRINITY_DN11684_c0_g3~~TRINITY_DN11684_c0_g3_i1.p2  ORF type:complete len:182 (+),score=45.49 TRINITY_DN11684_c0_g3_i1:3037-3582(+)
MVIVTLALVIQRRKGKLNPSNTIMTTCENQTFVGAKGHAGFEAFEVNAQDSLHRGEAPKPWDEAQYATTADGGVRAALRRNDAKWDKDVYDTSQASESTDEAIPSAQPGKWDQATYDINDKRRDAASEDIHVYAEASASAVTVADSADNYQYSAEVHRLTKDRAAIGANKSMIPTMKGTTA